MTVAALKKEIAYLTDSVKLADHTLKLLRDEDPEKAIEIVRLAGKSRDCVVSWNHIVDYHMSLGKVNTSIKMYNEVCIVDPYIEVSSAF